MKVERQSGELAPGGIEGGAGHCEAGAGMLKGKDLKMKGETSMAFAPGCAIRHSFEMREIYGSRATVVTTWARWRDGEIESGYFDGDNAVPVVRARLDGLSDDETQDVAWSLCQVVARARALKVRRK